MVNPSAMPASPRGSSDPGTRAARGLAAPARTSSTRPRPTRLHVDLSASIEQAFATIARTCVADVVARAEYARRHDDPESIHQLRVGIRRLRAALSIFSTMSPQRSLLGAAKKLRTLQQLLGAAREWDVLMEETISSLPNSMSGERGLGRLIKNAQARRACGHRDARAALRSRKCAQLLAGLEPLIARGIRVAAIYPPLHAEGRTPGPVVGFAAQILQAQHDKARKLGKKVRKLDQNELHELRIRIKKLRYATEFFFDLWPSRRAERYLAAVEVFSSSRVPCMI